ncbi:hypothetical protein DSCO28_53570 [Desulfosarcina ovata subsp. sediminis]|uniref:Uncharacterized protein n=1 Tax=Desulfosarcina ovata subsp. sediminis TaxID=885957 RepID=A0A5K7ZXF0_9BACT|nr:hypothetical protein DSCO28_53570 [Desulfosarcina ovata subsp. sediminis]
MRLSIPIDKKSTVAYSKYVAVGATQKTGAKKSNLEQLIKFPFIGELGVGDSPSRP